MYYHLRCKNSNCSDKGLHYNTEKVETKLKKFLNELTLLMKNKLTEHLISFSKTCDELYNSLMGFFIKKDI